MTMTLKRPWGGRAYRHSPELKKDALMGANSGLVRRDAQAGMEFSLGLVHLPALGVARREQGLGQEEYIDGPL